MKIPKILGIFIGLAFALVTLQPVHAAVFNCPAGDVACLIAAINAANANGEEDTINLPAGTFTLTDVNNIDDGPNGLPLITSKITIIGKGASMTFLNRDLDAPIFRIYGVKAQGDLELSQLTISGGNGSIGGGILNSGALSMTDCVVRDNHTTWSGAGIYNNYNAKLHILRCALRNNTADGPGGGIRIRPDGMVTIKESSIIDNAAGAVGCWAGGGIDFDAGNLTISNSSISGNTSCSQGGGMTLGGDTKIENCTITFNTSLEDGGGGIHTGWGGSGYIVNSTISGNEAMGNGGGINFGAPGFFALQNTIISNNSASMGINWYCISDDLGESIGNNLIEDPSGCDITLLSTDLTGDAGLDNFTDDVTPGKGHFPLLSNSQAIDKGNDDACLSTDQLGNPRVDGDGDGVIVCDIGAIEFQVSIEVAINILPKVLNLKSKGKKIISWIKLPEEYDPHDIARNSLELSIPSCSGCEVIYPTPEFPSRRRYIAFFPRQDLIDEIETIDLDLPTKLDLKITGELDDGTWFEVLDTIWVIKQK